MSQLSLSLFGAINVTLDNTPLKHFRSDKVLALLIYLAAEGQRAHRREALAGLLWPDHAEKDARHNLSQSLLRLRQLLKDQTAAVPFLTVTRQTIQFNQESNYQCDVTLFEAEATALPPEAQAPYLPKVLAAMRQAVHQYRGDFVAQFSLPDSDLFEEWVLIKREHYRQQALSLFHRLVSHYEQTGEYEAAHHYAWQQLALNPLNEEVQRSLMRLLALSGQQSAALTQYENCRQLLWAELGVEPASETVLLYEHIKAGQLKPATKPSPSPSVETAITRPDPIVIRSRLEPQPNQHLFGVDEAKANLIANLSKSDRPWIVALDGMGGIGKTTLATTLAHHFVEADRFFNIGWVSAKQEEFLADSGLQNTDHPALTIESLTQSLLEQLHDQPNLTASEEERRLTLTRLFKEQPHLIVIDNLETVADHEALLPYLRQLMNPSKFLLTTRFSLKGHSDIFGLSLSELSQADALAFVRYEAEGRGIVALTDASETQLERIYDIVGGNPLALKLIIGQVNYLPLGQVLDSLVEAKGSRVDQFYTYLYWQVWQMLSEAERHLFLAMPIVPNGTFAQLELASELDFDDLQQALTRLITLSIILVSGTLEEPRYRLHRLTETFLIHEVLKW